MNTPARSFVRWLALSLTGAILVTDPSDRLLLRAQETTAPAVEATNPPPQAEIEEGTEAAKALGEKEPSGFHFQFSPGGGEIVKIGSDALLKAGEQARELVVVMGNAVVDGDVKGDVVVVLGNATVNGAVGGDIVNVMGSSTFGPNAKVRGDCVVVGGKLVKDPAAHFSHEPVEVSFGSLWSALEPLGYWCKSGLLLGRPLPPSSGLAWIIVGLHFLIYLIIFVLIPKPVEACVKTLQTQALPSLLIGLLALILIGPLMLILVASAIGLLIVPFVWLAMLAAVYVGKTAVLEFFGLQLLGRWDQAGAPRPLLAFLLGTVIVTLLYMVPILGFIVYGVLLPLGLGAALMAAVTALRRNGATPAGPATAAFAGGGSMAGGIESPGVPSPFDTGSATGAALTGPTAAALATLPRAGFWIRFAATLLDFILFCWLVPTTGPFFLVVWLGYHIGMWTWKGTTIGGIVCSLKIVRLDGREVDLGVAVVRSLGSVLSFTALCLGFFWAGWNRERQSWHDTIAGTTIVKVPKGISLV